MTTLPVIFNDLVCHFLVSETFLTPIPREMYHVLSTTCLHVNKKAHVAYNTNCIYENEGLFKVTCSLLHCTCGNVSNTQDQ